MAKSNYAVDVKTLFDQGKNTKAKVLDDLTDKLAAHAKLAHQFMENCKREIQIVRCARVRFLWNFIFSFDRVHSTKPIGSRRIYLWGKKNASAIDCLNVYWYNFCLCSETFGGGVRTVCGAFQRDRTGAVRSLCNDGRMAEIDCRHDVRWYLISILLISSTTIET